MGEGPILLFDKSTLESLSVDEAVWLDTHYRPNITPLFFVETLADLEKEARTILRSLLGEITLKPTPEGLKAQLRGNIRGLLTFDEQAPVFLSMVAGAGFEPATFGL